MDITVRTVFRPLTLTGVEPEVDVSTVKAMLYELGQREQVPVPVPSKQRLVSSVAFLSNSSRWLQSMAQSGALTSGADATQVYKGSVLNTGSLKQAGFVSGEQLVLILPSRSACVKVTPVDTTPVGLTVPDRFKHSLISHIAARITQAVDALLHNPTSTAPNTAVSCPSTAVPRGTCRLLRHSPGPLRPSF